MRAESPVELSGCGIGDVSHDVFGIALAGACRSAVEELEAHMCL